MGQLKTLTAIVIFALVQCLDFSSAQEVNVLSFGDFMEFHIGLHKACERAPGGINTTWEMVSSFAQCTRGLESPQDKDLYDVHITVCKNRAKYLQCWDKLKADAMKKCGSDKGPMLPGVYRATAASICGNDNGVSKLNELRNAEKEVTRADQAKCPPDTGRHWIEQCQQLLPTMHSPDLCARHSAIDSCLKKMTCEQIKHGRLTTKAYSDGRAFLQCKS